MVILLNVTLLNVVAPWLMYDGLGKEDLNGFWNERALLRHMTFGMNHKTFYGRNYFYTVVSWYVCRSQSLSPEYNICGRVQEPTLTLESRKGLHLDRLQLSLQILGKGGSRKHTRLLRNGIMSGRKNYSTVPGYNVNYFFVQ